MFCLNRLFASRHISIVTAAAVILASALVAGTSGLAQTSPPRTGSSSSTPDSPATDTTSAPRIAQPEAGGSAITLENSEPLFFVAVALNACGYDAGLANSSPIRQKIRSEINEELTDVYKRQYLENLPELRQLREENAKLRRMVASLEVDRQILKDIFAKRIKVS